MDNPGTFQGEISSIAFGGQGICRHGDLVVFIPFTAVGDLIRFRITERKKNFAFGEMVELLQASKQRILPPCPYFGKCGGCQLQHLQYDAQLEYKRQAIEDAINRQAKLADIVVPPVLPASQQWAYRRRISLTLAPHNGRFRAGYMGVDNTSLITVHQCPIFCSPSDPIIQILQEIAESLHSTPNDQAKATILKVSQNHYLLHLHFKMMPLNAREILEVKSQQSVCLSGIVATAPNKVLEFGKLQATLDIDGLSFAFSPRAFVQSHPEQSLNIYRAIRSHVLSLTPSKGNILDLYCGIGISSLLLARQGFQVTAVEANGDAIKLAKYNAQKNGITNTEFMQGDVEKKLALLLKQHPPATVVVNPPREGLHPDVVRAFLENPPPAILYISCMPPTLARDLRLLCSETYKLKQVTGYDMFPQTSHVETLAILNSRRKEL